MIYTSHAPSIVDSPIRKVEVYGGGGSGWQGLVGAGQLNSSSSCLSLRVALRGSSLSRHWQCQYALESAVLQFIK